MCQQALQSMPEQESSWQFLLANQFTYHSAITVLLLYSTICLSIFYCNSDEHLLLVLVITGKIQKWLYLRTWSSIEVCCCTSQTPIELHPWEPALQNTWETFCTGIYVNTFNLEDYFQYYFTYSIYDHKHSSAFGNRMSRQYDICFLIGITKSCIEVESTLETSAYLVCYEQNISFPSAWRIT